MSLLDIVGVCRTFEALTAVDNATFKVEAGSVTGLVGPNGAGKTTLFNMVSGTLPPTSGEIIFDGHRVDHLPAYKRARMGIGRTFQDPRVFHQVSVRDNVLSGFWLRAERPDRALLRDPRTRAEWSEAEGRAGELLDRVGLLHRAADEAQDLSFGEQRFLSIARVLAGNPRLLLLDEPTVGLDAKAVGRLLEFIRDLARNSGMTILLVEHNMRVTFEICDYIHLLVQGTVVTSGTPEMMRRDPKMIEAYLGAHHAAVRS